MRKFFLILGLISSLSAMAEKVTMDVRVEVNIPICRRVDMVGTWDTEDEYRIDVYEISRKGAILQKLGSDQFVGNINRTLNLKNKTMNSTSRIKVDVYEEDWGIFGSDDYYPLSELDIEEYYSVITINKKVYDTNIYFATINSMECLNIDARETPSSIVRRNK